MVQVRVEDVQAAVGFQVCREAWVSYSTSIDTKLLTETHPPETTEKRVILEQSICNVLSERFFE